MSYTWNLIVITPLLAIFISCLHGMFQFQPFPRDRVLEELNGEIYKEIVAPNQNKYAFFYPPDLSRNGLGLVA